MPQFHERLSSVPSELFSPLASLCLPSYDTRSVSVNPSCTVIRLIVADGRRPGTPSKMSAEPLIRVAKSLRVPSLLRQKSRTVSRNLPFHSLH